MSLLSTSWLLDASLRASVAILLLLGLRPALRRWIGSRALAWLWLGVAACLLFPRPLTVPWRLPSLLPTSASTTASPVAFRVSVSAANNPANPGITALPRISPSPQTRLGPSLLPLLWLTGVVLAVARLARGWWMTRRWAALTIPADPDSDLQFTFLALPAALRRGVALRLTEALDVPTLVGIFRPQIWLPRALPATLAPAELRHVLLHELGHARRRDFFPSGFARWRAVSTGSIRSCGSSPAWPAPTANSPATPGSCPVARWKTNRLLSTVTRS